MIVRFRTAVPLERGSEVLWVQRPWALARMYLRSWFLVDLLSIIPFDALALVADSDDAAGLRAARVLRLLRLLRLTKVRARLADVPRSQFINTCARRWRT